MQETRQHILDILRERQEATVDELVAVLQERRGKITAVTVRHHLMRLQEDELITEPQVRHRTTPGRPQYVYRLTDKAHQHFPNNYKRLANGLLSVLNSHLGDQRINVILEDVGQRMAQDANIPNVDLEQRLKLAVEYLTEQGYQAHWEIHDEGYVLHTTNCPYHAIAHEHHTLCGMDMRLVASLVGVVPRMLSRVTQGDATCAYLIPKQYQTVTQ
jgi:DeoR family transcriptional regulator, suf operon transcriptional repressor